MQLSAQESRRALFFFFCVLLRSCHTYKNDATERLFTHAGAPVQMPVRVPELQSNASLNRARAGGRGAGGSAHDQPERSHVGCRELRSTKYISDGHCTSISPIKELVCAGECLPAQMLENWIGGARGRRYWARRSGNNDWRCVNDKTRTQRIQLQCQDGTTRTYKITVVTSCKCKRYSRQHNESGGKFEEAAALPPKLLHKHKSKSKRRLGKSRMSENWHEAEP